MPASDLPTTTGGNADHLLPLSGIRVVEAAQMISAPFATSLLSDQGADVIKVEARRGDRLRSLGDIRNKMGSVFHATNRGKRSIVLDTKTDDGVAILHELIRGADVFVQNFRPGVAERMGIGVEPMRALNPQLIYVSVSGFGATGPYADQMVYDFVIQALAGLASREGGDGPPRLSKTYVIDKATALTVSQAITAALFHRERTGEGQHVEIDMLAAGLQFHWPDGMSDQTLLGDDVTRVRHFGAAYDCRPTSDGHVAFNLATVSTWDRLLAVFDSPTIADDPRFATFALRQTHAEELLAAVDELLSDWTCDELLARMRTHDVPGARVLDISEVHTDPQVQHNGALVEHTSPSIGMLREPRPAARFGGQQTPVPAPAPHLGQHSDEILAELGYDSDRRQALRTKGVTV